MTKRVGEVHNRAPARDGGIIASFGYRSRFAVPVALVVFTALAGGIATALCLWLAGRDLRAPDRATLLGLSTGGILLVAATVIGAAYRVINHRVSHHRAAGPAVGTLFAPDHRPGRDGLRGSQGALRHGAGPQAISGHETFGGSAPIYREGEDRGWALADGVPIMIWVAGADRRCRYFNEAWLDFTGRELREELDCGHLGTVCGVSAAEARLFQPAWASGTSG